MNLLVMFLFAMSIYSMIRYTLRRSGNKRHFVQLKKKGKVLRTLSSAEREALTPVLHLAGVGKTLQLLNDNVYELNGEFLRHGIQGRHGSTMHDTLGGVDISLPYDSALFISENNRAEVVLTKKVAVVISLNDEFDLIGGQQRAQENLQHEHKWESGAAGTYGQLDHLTPEEQAEVDAEPDRFKVQLLGQRTENEGEMAARFIAGIGFKASCLLVMAFIAAMVANSHADSATIQLSAIAIAFILLFLAIRSFWRKPKPVEPQKINRARGYLHSVEIPDPNNAHIPRQEFFLGNKLPVVIPSHWLQFLSRLPDKPLDADIRVENRMLVKLGLALDLSEEERRFPDFYWGRHVTVVLVTVIMALGLLTYMSDPLLDLRLAGSLLTGNEVHTLNSDQIGEVATLEAGDLVNLTAPVRCQLPAQEAGYRLRPLDCRQVVWGGDAPRIDSLDADPLLHEFLAGEVVQTRKDPSLLAYSLRRFDPYGRVKRILRLKNYTAVIEKIDAMCQPIAASNNGNLKYDCRQLKSELLDEVVPVTEERFASWDELMAAVNKGQLKPGKKDEAVLLSSVAASLAERSRKIAEAVILDQAKEVLARAQQVETGGVVLALNYDKWSEAGFASNYAGSLLDQWTVYQQLSDPATYKTVNLTGLLVSNQSDSQGRPLLRIAEEFTPGWIVSATVRIVTLVILVLLAIAHSVFLVVNYRKSKEREKLVDDYNQMRVG